MAASAIPACTSISSAISFKLDISWAHKKFLVANSSVNMVFKLFGRATISVITSAKLKVPLMAMTIFCNLVSATTKVRNILFFFYSRSLKTREKYISFAQFVYLLSKKKHNCEFYHSKIKKETQFPQFKEYTN